MVCHALGRCRICARKHKLPIFGYQENDHVFIEKIHLQIIVLNTICMDCIEKFEQFVKKNGSITNSENPNLIQSEMTNSPTEEYTETGTWPKMEVYMESEEKIRSNETLPSHKNEHVKRREENFVNVEKPTHQSQKRSNIITDPLKKSFLATKNSGPKKSWIARATRPVRCKMYCDYCGKEFSHRGDMKRHQRKHTGEKPYECTECDKKFSQLSNLTRHRLVHSGEKPFACSQCGQSYSRKGRLAYHMGHDLCKRKVQRSIARL